MATAFASMTLSACASDGVKPPTDHQVAPVISTRFDHQVVCPPEVMQAVPAPIAVPDGAIIRANPAGDQVLDAKDAREQLLAQRLVDAQGKCPK